MTLTDVAAELYALPPAEFTAARNARAKQARADGDRALAGQVQALRRPTLAAWAVNLLVRHRPDDVEALLALGGQLLEAQAALAGTELRELARRQHAAMATLRESARHLADDVGQRLGDAVDVPLESTLRAAMTDPAAAAAVRSGLLVSDLESTGFGPVEVGDAVAVPAPPLTGAPPAPPHPSAADDDDAVPLPRRPPSTLGRRSAPSRPAKEPEPAPAPEPAAEPAPAPARPAPPARTTGVASHRKREGDPEATHRAEDERQAARQAKEERDAAARETARRHEREQAEDDAEAAQARAAAAEADVAAAEAAAADVARRRADLAALAERLAAELAEAEAGQRAAAVEERRARTARETAARAAATARRRADAARERLDALG